jgi:hypothetical protein
MITGFDHVLLAIPEGGEDSARHYYVGLLEMTEITKPAGAATRSGCWFSGGSAHLHVGVEADFRPAKKAHPALVVDDVDAVADALVAAGHACKFPENSIGPKHFHSHDPFGNRLEFRQA